MNYPSSIKNLIECYKKLPGIGEKSAERLALATLKLDEEVIDLFSDSIKNIQKRIRRCNVCNGLAEDEMCDICKDPSRNHGLVCVVEEPKNVISLKK